MREHLESSLWIPIPLDRVWEQARNLSLFEKITPPNYRLKGHVDGPTREGTRVEIEFAPGGFALPFTWVSRIADLQESPDSREFTDVQEKGPFRFWKHRHLFEKGTARFKTRDGKSVDLKDHAGTWVSDFVEFELPGGLLGNVIEKKFARPRLEEFFAFRRRKWKELFTL